MTSLEQLLRNAMDEQADLLPDLPLVSAVRCSGGQPGSPACTSPL